MKPVAFDLVRPAGLRHAAELLREREGSASVVAGSQSLGPMLNLRLAKPQTLIDITGIPQLSAVSEDGESVSFGACVTTGSIEDGRFPSDGLEVLQKVASRIAYRAVRNRGTIGGSLCHADPAADWPTALCALGAECVVFGCDGERRLPVAQFLQGAFTTALQSGELLTAIRVPRLRARERFGYAKFCRKVGEFASAIVAFRANEGGGVRMVLGATRAQPLVVPDVGASAAPQDRLIDGNGLVGHSAFQALIGRHGISEPGEQQLFFAVAHQAFAQLSS